VLILLETALFAKLANTLTVLLARTVVQIVQHVLKLLEPAQIVLLLIQFKMMALADVILATTMIVLPTRAYKQLKPAILDITMTVQIIVSLVVQIAQPVLLTQVSAPNVSMAPQLTL
jgi:hypothetical protein